MLSEPERSAILDAEVATFVRDGYRVLSRTAYSAQLVRPKQFSAASAILGFLLCGVGVLIYLFSYWAERDATAYLTVGEDGFITGQFDPPRPWRCVHCGQRNDNTRSTSCRSCKAVR